MSLEIPFDLSYSADHEWLRREGDHAVIGITAFAAGQLGDIVYVDVPKLGKDLPAQTVFGSIEAVKTVSDLFMPLAGTIETVNPLLADCPELVNSDPYGDGWLIRVKINSSMGAVSLLSAAEYEALIFSN